MEIRKGKGRHGEAGRGWERDVKGKEHSKEPWGKGVTKGREQEAGEMRKGSGREGRKETRQEGLLDREESRGRWRKR